MYPIRILNRSETRELLDMRQAVQDVEKAFVLYARQEAGVFPVIVHRFEPGVREMDIKSGHLAGANLFGLKMLGFCAENPARGLDILSGLIVVMDADTQQPVGIVDGTPITFLRTGAAGAVAAKTFARKGAARALLVGAGNQGRAQLMGLAVTLPGLQEIAVCDLNDEAAKAFVEEQAAQYPQFKLRHAAYSRLAEEAAQADLIVTCTRSEKAFLRREWIRPGTHINAIGTDMAGKQELEPELLCTAKVFADARQQATQKGESQYAAGAGRLAEADIGQLGDVLAGKAKGRAADDEITLFDATGMAIQDLIVAGRILENAKQGNIGTVVHI